jgi:hypothetical protein
VRLFKRLALASTAAFLSCGERLLYVARGSETGHFLPCARAANRDTK